MLPAGGTRPGPKAAASAEGTAAVGRPGSPPRALSALRWDDGAAGGTRGSWGLLSVTRVTGSHELGFRRKVRSGVSSHRRCHPTTTDSPHSLREDGFAHPLCHGQGAALC